MSPKSDRNVPAIPAVDPVVALLADSATRAIVVLLGEQHARGGGPLAVAEAALHVGSPRLIKDRLRALKRQGIVEPTAAEPEVVGAPTRWSLSPAGLDLYRLQALMTRVVLHASGLGEGQSPRERDALLGATLKGLSDPASLAIIDVLAREPDGTAPESLQIRCAPFPRRTLYRRLSLFVDQGVVTRTHSRSVPRTTTYAFVSRWRPVAAIPLLAAWWALRHDVELADAPITRGTELHRLLALVLPLVGQRPAGPAGAVVHWSVAGDEAVGDSIGLQLTSSGLTLLADGDEGAAPQALVEGSAAAWVAALVADRTGDLAFTGDARLARSTVNAVRAALLTYVR